MKLSASCIGWAEAPDDPDVLERLRAHGFSGVDVAPTRLWPGWEGVSVASAREWRRRFADQGFALPAAQSLGYGKEGLALFGAGSDALVAHLRWLAEPLAALGVQALVFGAPALRDPRGVSDPMARAAEVFARVAEVLEPDGLVLAIEPNPPAYGCTFVTTADEGAALVERVGRDGFGLHLDAGGLHLAGVDLEDAFARHGASLAHAHASEPSLGAFDAPVVDHAAAAAGLRAAGYSGWLALELRPAPLPVLDRALAFVASVYGDSP